MLSSLLLHLDGSALSEAVVRLGVEIAARFQARVRGLAIVDTLRLTQACMQRETAVFADYELNRMDRIRSLQTSAQSDLSATCLRVGLDFDVRRRSGDPVGLLSRESQFHDLVMTGVADPAQGMQAAGDFAADVQRTMDLLLAGVHPLLVIRRDIPEAPRVLLACDGSPVSGQAIKTFIGSQLWRDAELRLLAVEKSVAKARENLVEMAGYLRPRRAEFETGYVAGAVRSVLLKYMQKWEPDLVVLGMTRRNPILRRLLGEVVSDALRRSSTSLYVSG